MGILKKSIAVALLIIGMMACDKYEAIGFITSYEDANERFEQSMDWNASNPIPIIMVNDDNYVLYAMGDSHLGGTENLNKFFDQALANDVTAVLLAGDITSGHQKDYDNLAEILPDKDSLIYFPMAGNHDLYFHGWEYFYPLLGSSTYSFVVQTPDTTDLFICLDTGSGTLGDKQLKWLKEKLEKERGNHRYCSVITHNNIIRPRPTASTNPFVEEVRVLLDLFAEYDVDIVVNAHDHKRSEQVFGNTAYVIMDALLDENSSSSYLELKYSEDNVQYSFVEI